MKFTVNKLDSSFVRRISYDSKRKELTVQLLNNIYIYENFPNKKAIEFINSESKGKYFNQNIKDEYDAR
jgi:hypothetical protein